MDSSIDIDLHCDAPDMLNCHGNIYGANLRTMRPCYISFLGPLPNLTDSIKVRHALVRFCPIQRTGADLELRLQNDILAIIWCWEACILDVQVSGGLVVLGHGNISAGYILC
jgi:hypothetical protein